MCNLRSLAAMLFTCAAVGSIPARAQCLEWKPGFNLPGVGGIASAMTVFDDGTGPALYVAGDFRNAGDVAANYVAKWNGSTWSALGAGTTGRVRALAVFDDGSGAALYAGGNVANPTGGSTPFIVKWNGSSWSSVVDSLTFTFGQVWSLAVFDDGAGPELYAAGPFDTLGSPDIHGIMKWDGSTWTRVGSGIAGSTREVGSMTVFDDGSGPALYVGGRFDTVDGVDANGFAKWDGSRWTGLGSSLDGEVLASTVFDDGSGPALYIGGWFTTVDGIASGCLARWDGTSWTGLGAGLGSILGPPSVLAIQGFDDGTGPKIYVSGYITTAGGAIADGTAVWNGTEWLPLGSGLIDYQDVTSDIPGTGNSFAIFDEGSGTRLYLAGKFDEAGGVSTSHVARWDGSTWSGLGSGHGITGYAQALALFDDGSGRALYASTVHRPPGGPTVGDFVKWDGADWSRVEGGVGGGGVVSMTVHDDGSGPALFVGGTFSIAGGQSANRIARWDGQAWTPLGSGMETPNGTYVSVGALRSFDDGSGPALYAGGFFTVAGGVPASNIARWNGTIWSAVGTGLDGAVTSFEVFDDGTGPGLYAGGYFNFAGSVSTAHIARWNGTQWSSVGDYGMSYTVRALAVVDLGSGPGLFAGGDFLFAGGTQVNHVARWNGTSWASLGAGSPVVINNLAGFDDGWGTALYAGGPFEFTPRPDRPGISRWNGSTWTGVGSGVSQGEGYGHGIAALAVGDLEGDGAQELYVGGNFGQAGLLGSNGIAVWLGCVPHGSPVCAGDGTGAPCPCGNSGWPGNGCNNAVYSGGARLTGRGAPSLASDSLSLDCTNVRPNVLCLVFQGDQRIAPVFDGDGLRCAAGHVKRLYAHNAVGSLLSVPDSGDPSLSARSSALGDPLSAGDQRIYQVYYRDKSPTFCPNPPGNLWNLSSGLRVEWLP